MLVDSHCHLNFEPMGEQLSAVLDEARDAGVGWMLCVAVDLEHINEILDICRKHLNIFASLGVHPNEEEGRDADAAELVALGAEPLVVAIGETGLDYYRVEGKPEWQRRRFVHHIEAAITLDKPLIIHTRDSMDDTLELLEQHDAARCGGVMHCFSGDWSAARRALDIGFYLSFSGILTFKNAATVREVATRAPAERILVETDAPFLAPVPHRGKPNRPAYVRHTAEALAQLRGLEPQRLAEQTTDNFFRLFRHAQRNPGAPD